MQKRGKPSSEDLITRPVLLLQRKPAPPPPELTPAEAGIWETVMRSPAGAWIGPEAHALLIEYAASITLAGALRGEIQRFDLVWARDTDGQKHLDRLLAMHDRVLARASSLAVKLRVAPSSRVHKQVAGRQVEQAGEGPKPWDECVG